MECSRRTSFSGLARDYFGTRIAVCSCLLCALVGAVGIALVDANNAAGLGASLFVLSFSSGVILLQSVGELFPTNQSAIITSITGAFYLSGLMFLVLGSLPVTRRVAFLGYAGVLTILVSLAWTLLPNTARFTKLEKPQCHIKSQNQDYSDHSGFTLDESESGSDAIVIEADCNLPTSQVRIPTKMEQIFSTEYLLLLLWFSLCYLPGNFYIGSIGFILEEIGDVHGYYTYIFSFIYAGSSLVAPFGGYLSDRFGLGVTQGLGTVLVSSSLLILGAAKYLPLQAQIASFICYGVGFLLVSGTFYSNLGCRFGYTNFGTLGGLGLLVAATFSLLQYPILGLVSNGGTSSAAIINFSAAAVLLFTMIPYCAWLAVMERRHDAAVSLLKRKEEVVVEEPVDLEQEIDIIIEC